jgi:integrase
VGRAGGGVKPHGKGIQLTIYYRGERLRPTLPVPPTAGNLKYANRLLSEIRSKIRVGAFDPADYFPEYRGLPKLGASSAQTFDHYVDTFLAAGKARLSPSTLDVYRKVLKGFWLPRFEGRGINTIRHSEITLVMGETPWKSLKTYNNWLSCLRRVFALAKADGLKTDPTDGIAFAKPQRAEPDPFSREEADKIIAWFRARESTYADYFEFAFYAGMRPSEQIAVLWDDCDLTANVITVRRARVVGVDRAATKTSVSRQVELSGRAVGALRRQQSRSRVAGKHVWLNPYTGKRFADEQSQWKAWGSALKALGLRYRVPYQTRHTCATIMLMAGANPAWCAKQLGHSPEMFWRVYSKWIEGADRGKELAKVEHFLTATGTATKK